MNDAQVDALAEAADSGVNFDGLRASRAPDGFRLSAADLERSGLSADGFHEAAASVPDHVTNWYFWTHAVGVATDARYAFLRWLERADERGVAARYAALESGVSRQWGELSIEIRIDEDGTRRYGVRHEADRDRDLADLRRYRDPRDAREIATLDDCGRYRPLSTAPTLRTGWAFADLSAAALVRAVHHLYPATVENWHLERRGVLDVTHWREAAARQTGIYAAVSDLPDRALPWAVEACCTDGACVKRRRWERDDETTIGVERGDGEFPCREPCSLFVAAARTWADLEGAGDGSPDASTGPSARERAQVRAVLDAVAEGRVDEVPAADFDDPANRYRVRYLRAKYGEGFGLAVGEEDDGIGDDGGAGTETRSDDPDAGS